MARKPAFKAPPRGSSSATSHIKSLGPPEPFAVAPETFRSFFEQLSLKDIYITHVDRKSADFQKRIFAVPFVLNLALTVLIVWRLYMILPWYGHLMLTIWGYDSPTTIDRTDKTFWDLCWILLKRTGSFLIDYLLLRIVLPWPYGFFWEEGNPVQWRWSVGFRDKEIYVRKSRGFTTKEFLEAGTQGRENPYLKVRIVPAVDQVYLREKSGYATMGADWDLEFENMVLAEGLVDMKKMKLEDFERKVWLYCGDAIGWCMWDVDFEEGSADDEEFLKKLAAQVDKERGV